MVFNLWTTWRRDTTIALVSASLTALVLVSVGWAIVHAERGHAQAAREAEAEARSQAEENAAQARKYREELEAVLARRLLRVVGHPGPGLAEEELDLLDQLARRAGRQER
jgi:hypothetical protein